MKATTKQLIADLSNRAVKDTEYQMTLAQKVYDATEDELVNCGYYDVIEHNESMFSMGTKRMTIEITKPINKKDLAVQLLHDKQYYSPWLYLVLRKHEIKTDYEY